MSFLLPRDKHWNVANWVSRGFFEDARAYLEEAPSIADDIRFCIDTDTDTIDLRDASQIVLTQLLILVDKVIAANRSAGATSFHNPEARPTYLQLLEQLRNTVASLAVQAS
jgi:hypothetical protein